MNFVVSFVLSFVDNSSPLDKAYDRARDKEGGWDVKVMETLIYIMKRLHFSAAQVARMKCLRALAGS